VALSKSLRVTIDFDFDIPAGQTISKIVMVRDGNTLKATAVYETVE